MKSIHPFLLTRSFLIVTFCALWILCSPGWAQMTLNNRLLTQSGQEETGDQLGEALAVGDFNGDGFEDLAVGAPHEDFTATDEGVVWIYFGSTNGLDTDWGQGVFQFNITDTTCGGSEDGDLFGYALAAGDFNHDGYDDLAIGSPKEDIESPPVSEAGLVVIAMGSPTGLNFAASTCLYQLTGFLLPGTAEAGDWLGWSLAVGNFNGDSYDDLAIGAPFDGTGGTVTEVLGSASGLDIANAEVWTQNTAGMVDATEVGDRFGAALATGDLFTSGSTDCDLVVGVPGEDTSRGAIHVIYGCTGGGLSASGNQIWRLSDLSSPQTGAIIDSMGQSLAVGNFDGVKGADVAAGVPFRNTGAGSNVGAVAVFYSGGSGGLAAAGSEFIEAIGNGPAASERFGDSLAAANVEGQCDDLFIGSPFAERGSTATDHGQLILLRGAVGEGLVPIDPDDWDFARLGLVASMSEDDHLGWSIAVGRFNGVTPSVAAGVPGHDNVPVTETESGTVLVLESRFLFADGFESGGVGKWSSNSL